MENLKGLNSLPKAQKIQLALSVLVILATLIYTFFAFPNVYGLFERMGALSEISPTAHTVLQLMWGIPLLPIIFYLFVFASYRKREKVGQIMLIFAVISAVLMIALTCYMSELVNPHTEFDYENIKVIRIK